MILIKVQLNFKKHYRNLQFQLCPIFQECQHFPVKLEHFNKLCIFASKNKSKHSFSILFDIIKSWNLTAKIICWDIFGPGDLINNEKYDIISDKTSLLKMLKFGFFCRS